MGFHQIRNKARRTASNTWNPFQAINALKGGNKPEMIGENERDLNSTKKSIEPSPGDLNHADSQTLVSESKLLDANKPTSEDIEPGQGNGNGSMTKRNTGIEPQRETDNGDVESNHTIDSAKARRDAQTFTFWSQVKGTIFNSWINLLLIFVPVGIALNYTNADAKLVFTLNFLAIIPLAGLLAYATEEIAIRIGETLGGLMNASFGNAVELIVAIIALTKDEIIIVQTSLIGSILSNLLLVMGMCFFFGGINRKEQNFSVIVAQTASSLLALAVGSLIIPTAFRIYSGGDDGVAQLSRGAAIILLLVYACYLFFQLKTHNDIFSEKSEKVPQRKDLHASFRKRFGTWAKKRDRKKAAAEAADPRKRVKREEKERAKLNDEEIPELSLWTALITLAISTVFIALCAEFMVGAIDTVTTESGLSKEFVGLILLPIVGNAAEHATAVTVAIKDKMDLAIGVAVGSSMQIALLVIPLAVVLGWITGHNDMTLYFDGFQIAVLFVSILLVNYLIQDGKSNWLEGVLLMAAYTIIAIAAFFYPKGQAAA